MALLLAILEHWNDSKRGKGRSQWVKMSFQQFADGMYGLFARCTIQDSLEILIGEGLVSRQSYRYADNNQYEYRFNYQLVNERLAVLPPRNQEDMAPTGDYQEVEEGGLSSKEIRVTSNERRGSSKEIRVTSNEMLHRFNTDTNTDTTQRESPPVAAESPVAASPPGSSLSPEKRSSESFSHEKEPAVPSWDAPTCRETFYTLQGVRPRYQKQIDEDTRLAAEVLQTTSQEEFTMAFTRMKADPYWKPKPFSLETFVKHLPEYLHAAPPQEKQNGNTPPSKRLLGGPPSEGLTQEERERNKKKLLAKRAERQAAAASSQQPTTANA
jgi:hypothetical protein